MKGGDPCSWEVCVVWLWGPASGSGASFLPCTLRDEGWRMSIALCGLVVLDRLVAHWRSGWTPVGPGEKSSALLEVCCMTLAQHTSTICDPACNSGCGHWLMLNKCWRSASLLCVWLLGFFSSDHIHLYMPPYTTQTPHALAYYTHHIHHCLSLSVLSFHAPLSVIVVL